MKNNLTSFVLALADLERNSKGYFRASNYVYLYRDLVAKELRLDDRVDLAAPAVFEIGASQQPAGPGATKVKPRGDLRTGIAVTLQDRALFLWQQGTIQLQKFSAVVPYDSVQAVNEVTFRAKMENILGFELIASKRWPVLFTNNPKAPDRSFWRRILQRRLDGTYEPLWEGNRVTRWISPGDIPRLAFRSPTNGRLWDTGWLKDQLGEDERVEAAVGGGIAVNCNEGPGGLLLLTTQRLIVCSKNPDPPYFDSRAANSVIGAVSGLLSELPREGDSAVLDRAAMKSLSDAGTAADADFDVIALKFADGTVWTCTSEAREPQESQAFMNAVRNHSATGGK